MQKLRNTFRNCYPEALAKTLYDDEDLFNNQNSSGRKFSQKRTYIASSNVIFIAKPAPDQGYLVGGTKLRFEWRGGKVFGQEIERLYRERRRCILGSILGPRYEKIGGQSGAIHADTEGQALEATSLVPKSLCRKCRKLYGFITLDSKTLENEYGPLTCAEDAWEAKKRLMDKEMARE